MKVLGSWQVIWRLRLLDLAYYTSVGVEQHQELLKVGQPDAVAWTMAETRTEKPETEVLDQEVKMLRSLKGVAAHFENVKQMMVPSVQGQVRKYQQDFHRKGACPEGMTLVAEEVVHLLAAAFPQETESEVHLVHPLKVAHY